MYIYTTCFIKMFILNFINKKLTQKINDLEADLDIERKRNESEKLMKEVETLKKLVK